MPRSTSRGPPSRARAPSSSTWALCRRRTTPPRCGPWGFGCVARASPPWSARSSAARSCGRGRCGGRSTSSAARTRARWSRSSPRASGRRARAGSARWASARARSRPRGASSRARSQGALTRRDAYAALERAGIATGGQRGIHVVNHLAHGGLLCLGPHQENQPTIALLDELAPRGRPIDLPSLAARYAASHGPASAADFAWWTGTGKREAQAALAAAEGIRERDGLWEAARPRAARAPRPDAHLLPAFDESGVAYKDRSAALERIDPRRTGAQIGLLSPSVVVDGQMVGTWGRTLARDRVRIALKPLAPLTRDEREAIEAAAERYARFLGLALEMAPR